MSASSFFDPCFVNRYITNKYFTNQRFMTVFMVIASWGVVGCDSTEPIVTYRVSTKVPSQFQVGQERMLAAMVPSGDQVWFFKVMGPEAAVASIESTFRSFVEDVTLSDGAPDLTELPAGWKIGAKKSMRFASIDVDTPEKQLDISVSQLSRQDDYDAMVAMNVNRWRGQLSLDPSQTKWAEAEPMDVAAADGDSVWVDLIGTGGDSSMSPPFAGGNAPFAGGPSGAAPFAGGAGPAAGTPPAMPPTMMAPPADAEPSPPDERLGFDRPEGWRDGRSGGMRLAAFDVGPEDAPAEITVIPAGGDLRGNVARWLGQIREGQVADEVVDQAMADVQEVDVDGRSGQRFHLTGQEADSGTAIDATIVPMDGGMSLFIKMTGPAKTVADQSDSIGQFLDSLELKF